MPAIAREKLWTRDFVFGTAVNFLIMVNYYGLMVVVADYAMKTYDAPAATAGLAASIFVIGAQDESVELVFAHVVKLYGLGTGAETVLLDEAKKVLVEMEQLADEVPNKAHAHLLKGSSPADLLLKCAQDEGCDLIVMGSRGQGGVKGFLGSVSYAVVQGSPIAVLIAKDAPAAATKAGATD